MPNLSIELLNTRPETVFVKTSASRSSNGTKGNWTIFRSRFFLMKINLHVFTSIMLYRVMSNFNSSCIVTIQVHGFPKLEALILHNIFNPQKFTYTIGHSSKLYFCTWSSHNHLFLDLPLPPTKVKYPEVRRPSVNLNSCPVNISVAYSQLTPFGK